ncbi:aromatic-ring hydroxylase C-terminal domain-containing protein [Streptosporangium sp. NPDC003464]
MSRACSKSASGSTRSSVAQAATDTGALLVRPDGYVAWAGGRDSLGETLAAWFGPAR